MRTDGCGQAFIGRNGHQPGLDKAGIESEHPPTGGARICMMPDQRISLRINAVIQQ
jgi:hypothetical protein